MIKLKYFKKSSHICGSDFEREEQEDTINVNHIVSVSDLMDFKLPFSGKHVGKFALVTMCNDDKYFIKENSYKELLSKI